MDNKQKHILTISGISFLFLLFYLIKFFNPLCVTALYQREDLQLLNALIMASPAAGQPVEYYLGMAEMVLFGPACLFLSGLAFLVFSLKYLVKSSGVVFGLCVFCYLVLTKFEVLFFPPYGDSASGPFMEAVWLYHNNFDYAGLSRQAVFVNGGPKVYLFCLYPAYIALLMKIIPTQNVFFAVNHLLVFFYGAVIISVFRRALMRMFDRDISMLASLLLLSFPLFQSQVEQINMEIPTILFTVLSMDQLMQKRLGPACAMAVLAILFKGTGIFAGAVVFFVGMFLFFFDDRLRFKPGTLFFSLLALLAALIHYYATFFILYSRGNVAMVGLFDGWYWIRTMPVFFIYLLGLGIFLVNFWKKKEDGLSFIGYLKKNYFFLVASVFAAGWFALYINSLGGFPRYRLVLAPFTLLIAVFAAGLIIRSQDIMKRILIPAVLFSFICGYGLLYKRMDHHHDSDHERSLEYRNDIRLDMYLARLMQTKYERFKIGAPFTVAHVLAYPELGFVQKELDVMMYGHPTGMERIKPFKGLDQLDILRTVWIAVQTSKDPQKQKAFPYPIGPHDKVLERVVYGDRDVTIFLGGVAIEKMRLATRQVLKILAEKGMLHKTEQGEVNQ